MSALSTIWENTDGCTEQYRCATSLYLMSVLSQLHSIIFDRGVSAPGHGKEVVNGLIAIDKRYMYQLMSIVQLPGSKIFEKQIVIILEHKKRTSVWLKNIKNIYLMIIVNIESFIRGEQNKRQ